MSSSRLLPRTDGKRSAASKRQLAMAREHQKRINRDKPCSVSGCPHHRHDLSVYCHKHWKRHRRYGTPVGDLPTKGELRAIESAIKDWLQDDHLTTDMDRKSFKMNWGSAQKTIRTNPAFAISFSQLEGNMRYTQKAKGWIILSHYFHRQGNSLSDAMLRAMACRLWAEFKWRMPDGKRGFAEQRNYFVDTHAGYFVLDNSGFFKTATEEKTIGWEKPWYISDDPRENQLIPITEKKTKKVYLSRFKAGPGCRALGAELRAAVEHAMGTRWVSDHRLLERTARALDLPHASQPNTTKHLK